MHAHAIVIQLQARIAPGFPPQWQQLATQRQHAGLADHQRRRQVLCLVIAQLRGQPTAVLLKEALTHHQAGARRQGQPHATLIHAEFDPARARIAHAQHVDLGILQAQAHGIALQRGGNGRGDQAAEESGHGYSIAPVVRGI
ncbi:hypothetical protein D9M71_744260 [compost metagenome]